MPAPLGAHRACVVICVVTPVSVHVTEKTGGASFCASVSVFVFVFVFMFVLVLVLVFAFFLVVPPPCSAQSVAQAAADAAQHARDSVALLVQQKILALLVQKYLLASLFINAAQTRLLQRRLESASVEAAAAPRGVRALIEP